TYARNYFFAFVENYLDELEKVYDADPGNRIHYEAYLHREIGVELGIVSNVGLDGIDDTIISDHFRQLLDFKVRDIKAAFSPELIVAEMMRKKEVSTAVVTGSTGATNEELYDEAMGYLTLQAAPVFRTCEDANLLVFALDEVPNTYDQSWIAFVRAGMEYIWCKEEDRALDVARDNLVHSASGLTNLFPSSMDFQEKIQDYFIQHQVFTNPTIEFFQSTFVKIEIEQMVHQAEKTYYKMHHQDFYNRWCEIERVSAELMKDDGFTNALKVLSPLPLDGDLLDQLDQMFVFDDLDDAKDFFTKPGNICACFKQLTDLLSQQRERNTSQAYKEGIAATFAAMAEDNDHDEEPRTPRSLHRILRKRRHTEEELNEVRIMLPLDGTTETSGASTDETTSPISPNKRQKFTSQPD
ncbi:MAG: hypothetical protein P0S94_03275, partial [Simkaniaceae bacterium]|nr:hypothetical protein [Simkaniaceae bacterium]